MDKIVVDSELESIVIPNPNCCFYLTSFAERLIRDEHKQLMSALMPAVKPATVTQEQVLTPYSLKFDVNQRRTARLSQYVSIQLRIQSVTTTRTITVSLIQ